MVSRFADATENQVNIEEKSAPASHSLKFGPTMRAPDCGFWAPERMAFPARPGTRSGTTTVRRARIRTTWRASATRFSSSGPAISRVVPKVGPTAVSRRTYPTARAATGWILMTGTGAIGPLVARARICTGNSWNCVARTIFTGSGPARAADS